MLSVTVLANKKGVVDVFEDWAVSERHCGVSIVHMANSQTPTEGVEGGLDWGGCPPSLPCHALTEACVDTVLANLILIVRSKEWWSSPRPSEIIKFISLAA